MSARRGSVWLLAMLYAGTVAAFQISWLPSLETGPAAQPQITLADNSFLLSWHGLVGPTLARLRFLRIQPDGRIVGEGEVTDRALATAEWALAPTLVASAAGHWWAQWLQPGEGGAPPQQVYAHSVDAGRSWSAPHAVHSTAATPWTWLPSGGEMPLALRPQSDSLQQLRLYASGEQEQNDLIENACPCCRIEAIAVDGGHLALYLEATGNHVAGARLLRHDGRDWQAPEPLINDLELANACQAGVLAMASHGRSVAVAAFGAAQGDATIWIRASRNGGSRWWSPVVLAGEGSVGRVGLVAIPGGRFVLSQVQRRETGLVLRLSLLNRDGIVQQSTDVTRLADGDQAGWPKLAALGDSILITWVEVRNGETGIAAAIVRVPSR